MPRITYTRTVAAGPGTVFAAATDYEALPSALPRRFASVRVRSRRGDVSVVEQRVRLQGRNLVMMTKHVIDPPRRHEVFVIGGDARGSRITESYDEVAGGTLVTVDADIRLGMVARIAEAFRRGRAAGELAGIAGEVAETAVRR